ncbi:hypothetical protein KAR91_54365 [Candidatus Pacearchaeota archaeon]|nr:hypothetical protein [Candidatus Pacearchaeota archaeon]
MDILYNDQCMEAFIQMDMGSRVRILLGRCSVVVEKAELMGVYDGKRQQPTTEGQAKQFRYYSDPGA